MLKQNKIYIFIFLLLLTIVGMLIPARLTYTTTDSVGYRLFFYTRNPKHISKGDYVMFRMHVPHISNKAEMLIKIITCDEGDLLQVIDRDYYCNYEFIGKAKEYSLKGEKLNNFVFSGRIPKGYVFVSSRHKDSYDSRYFGLIPKSKIEAIAHPIL